MADELMDPRTRARQIAVGDPVRWKLLELDALRRHRQVVLEIDPVRAQSSWRDRISCIVASLYLPALLAPALGAVLTVQALFSAATPSAPAGLVGSALVFIFADVVLLLMAVSTIRGRQGGRLARGIGAYLVVSSIVAAASTIAIASRSELAGLWAVPSVVGVLIGALLVGAPVAARMLPRPLSRRERAQAIIESLSARERERIGSEMFEAIETLAERGIISRSEADWAHGAELGMLPVRMSERRPRL
ncbi:hypothetical protein [Agrococcus sp. ARC_14]|uniref:hypothetical protein n=1 Tax=Agrococcus sp. ARC_14 TaxID=2919927 RepID=UPI001F05BF98|nr:hypothetical protein [Agrococcus sp. ARC_14]MCH1882970.1 hypothetical protein [Agrococcus sp. ARC_14]